MYIYIYRRFLFGSRAGAWRLSFHPAGSSASRRSICSCRYMYIYICICIYKYTYIYLNMFMCASIYKMFPLLS